jgi:hypothetical protein
MSKLAMPAFHPHLEPTVPNQQRNEFFDLHDGIVASSVDASIDLGVPVD